MPALGSFRALAGLIRLRFAHCVAIGRLPEYRGRLGTVVEYLGSSQYRINFDGASVKHLYPHSGLTSLGTCEPAAKAGLLRGGREGLAASTNRDIAEERGLTLEVNVIFTDPAATAVALQYAASLAQPIRVYNAACAARCSAAAASRGVSDFPFHGAHLGRFGLPLAKDAAEINVHLYR